MKQYFESSVDSQSGGIQNGLRKVFNYFIESHKLNFGAISDSPRSSSVIAGTNFEEIILRTPRLVLSKSLSN